MPIIRIVDTAASLSRLGDLLRRASLVCLDCEWPPRGHPSATLLQLGVLEGQGDRYERHVVIVDVQQLIGAGHRAQLRLVLLAAFADRSLLKLAHSLTNDISALIRGLDLPLEHHGVVKNAADVRQLMTRLGFSGMKQIGLSAMLERVVGMKLSKELQCSEWDVRPLTVDQVKYAAADASCLVELFLVGVSAFVASSGGVEASHRWAGAAERRPPTPETPGGGGRERSDRVADADAGAVAGAAVVGTGEYATYDVETVARWIDAGEVDERVFRAFGRNIEWRNGRWRHVTDDDNAFWAARTRQQQKKKTGKNVKDTRVGHHDPGAVTTGVSNTNVPWERASDARFLADEMMVGCCRELRLFGLDVECVCAPTTTGVRRREHRHVIHRRLVDVAEAEERVVLTRDAGLIARRLTDRIYFVRSDEGKRQQAEEVMAAFGIRVGVEMLMSRCSQCNGELVLVEEPAGLPAGAVPEAVLESVDEFWVCSGGAHVYWRGGQYARGLERLCGQLDQLNV